MKVLQKHVLLAIIFCILLCDVRIGLIFKYFVICETPGLGDDFILGNSKKNLQKSPRRTKITEAHNPRLFHDNSELEDVICKNLYTYIFSCPYGGGMTELPSLKYPNVPTLNAKKTVT
jgi:hypothetical protein